MRLKKWLFNKITISLLLMLCVITRIICGYFSKALNSYTDIIVKNYAEDVVIDSVNNKLLSSMDNTGFLNSKFDADGKVAYAYLDTKKVNFVRNKTAEYMNEIVDEIENCQDFKNIELPLDYLLGVSLFNLSIDCPISLEAIGNEDVDLELETKMVGINTSLVEINLNITIEVVVFMPLKKRRLVVVTKLPLALEMVNNEVPVYFFGGMNK